MSIFEITLFGITIAPSYYGLMYALGFLGGYYIIKKRGLVNSKHLDDLLIYMVAGVVLGGRIGYILFYNFEKYINNPIDMLKVWEGGMSFHGGVIGVILGMIIFAKRYKINFYKLADQITAVLPIGLGLGRIGNYLNGELLGHSGYTGFLSVNGRFPSPLVEALLEGLILFIILNIFYKRPLSQLFSSNGKGVATRFDGQIASLFLIFYGIFRIFVEAIFREPDIQIGYIAGYFTMGEILSLPMIIIGVYYYLRLKK